MSDEKGKKAHSVIWTIIALAIIMPISGVAWFMHEFNRAVRDTTDIARYAEAISPQELEPQQQAIFPPVIPAQATDVFFFFRPHFLQGNAMVELRFNAGSSLEAMHRNLMTTPPPSSGPTTRQSNFPLQIRTVDNKQFEDLPPDFEVWYYYESSGNGGNNVFRALVAGSEKRREIIYVAQ